MSVEFGALRLPYSKIDCHMTLSNFNARDCSMQERNVPFTEDVMDWTVSKLVLEYFLSVKILGASGGKNIARSDEIKC